jgi:3-oxoacyl-[acyl-carrier-protein] synthase III
VPDLSVAAPTGAVADPSPDGRDAPAPSGILPVAVAGLGAHLPEQVVTNDDLAERLDTSDEWIRTRTGIAQRHVAATDVATADLATAAARSTLSDAGLEVDDLAMLVVATTTPDHLIPGTAPLVAERLGTQVAAMDLNAACSGFVYGLQVAGSLAATGGAPVLLIGAETLTRVVDPEDRATAVPFGDGPGAAVLVPRAGARLGPFALGADGSDPAMLWRQAGGTRQPTTAGDLAAGRHLLSMRGGDVYRHAVVRMADAASDVLARADLDVGDVDLLIGHQANARIIEAVRTRLGVAPERSHVTVDRHANTSAASIPLALADARDAGRLQPGDRVLLAAFGAGLTWGACLLTWQPDHEER